MSSSFALETPAPPANAACSRVFPWARDLMRLARAGIGCLFLFASIGKLYQPYEFLGVVYDYSLFGPVTGLAIAAFLPWLELVVAIALILDFLSAGALLVGTGLFCMFTLVKVSILWRGLDVGCGCLGVSPNVQVTPLDIFWTGALFAIGLAVLVLSCWGTSSQSDAVP